MIVASPRQARARILRARAQSVVVSAALLGACVLPEAMLDESDLGGPGGASAGSGNAGGAPARTGNAGGPNAGTGNAAGAKAGTGGTGAKAGAGGTTASAPVNAAVCKTETAAAIMGARSADCVNCICDVNAAAVLTCTRSSTKRCWSLVNCIFAMCSALSGTDVTACAIGKCSSFIDAATDATTVGAVLSGTMCSSRCNTSTGTTGIRDAGL